VFCLACPNRLVLQYPFRSPLGELKSNAVGSSLVSSSAPGTGTVEGAHGKGRGCALTECRFQGVDKQWREELYSNALRRQRNLPKHYRLPSFLRSMRTHLAIYSAMSYLDATMDPTYHEVEPTAAYKRGQELRDALYGPIIPAPDDEHLKRCARASGECELAFGLEPIAGDILRRGHLELVHSPQNYAHEFGRFIEAWRDSKVGRGCQDPTSLGRSSN
jgi:hypothetical protein